MLVKHPTELHAGDRLWFWEPRGRVTVTEVEPRPYDTALVHLADGRVVEIYADHLVR